MDNNTIDNQPTKTQNPSPLKGEKESNHTSDTNNFETHKTHDEHVLNSNILNGDSFSKYEKVNDEDRIVSEDSKRLDETVTEVKIAAEDHSPSAGVSLDKVENVAHEVAPPKSSLKDESASEIIANDKSDSHITPEKEEWMDVLGSGQLKKKVLRPGTSSFRPARSWLCQLTFEACLPDGKVVDKCENLNIQIGDGEVVEGLDLVLPLMDVGELALVEVAPRFAYNSLGLEPDIPPNSTLMYTVELLSAQPEPELETIPAAERKKIGNSKRTHGNKWYERQKYTLAIQCYRRALEYLDEIADEVGTVKEQETDELQSLLEDRLKVYNNMAAAQMKIEAYDAALTSVGHVLLCQPNNVKALYRKGKILRSMGNNSEARTVLAKASALDPNSKIIQKELQTVSQVCKVEARKEKDLYKKMFTKDAAAAQPKNTGRQIPWGAIVGSVSAAAVAIIATLAAYKYKFM